ncbi:dephospho-CoA kinase [Haliovirga abyssi]|uniref:Dephospho-CoA kinase n=1 Tax=Haliovirga abyssi TaxID=2996794 RepID=A0AAU9DF73_9FUSO|nr:dephospho-CoA kinase [Haliovirga abyssi]BDU50017.1 dephospho-CoA kinase [Haliovirga abyssi]
MIVGLTGGVATGKSEVSKMFNRYGAIIIDADKISRDVVNKKEVLSNITEYFGKDIMKKGKLDRKKLGKIVFSDEEKKKKLNEITHPLIIEELKKYIDKYKESKELIIFDIPLLFEVNFEKYLNKVIVVYCGFEIELNRLMKRENINYSEAVNIIKSQMDLKEKLEKGDILIENSGTIEELEEKVFRLYSKLKRD